MFEVAEVGEKLSKKDFQSQAAEVRESLLDAQARLRESNSSLVIVIAGVTGAGKGETVNFLLEWLDAREVVTHALGITPEAHEAERPFFYRFWERLPPQGKTAIFFGSWYTEPIVNAIKGSIDDAEFDHAMQQIVEFERMLVHENTLLLKFWLHITKKQQKKHFKELEDDPNTAWRVTSNVWKLHKTYDRFLEASSGALRQTSSGHAPWHIIEAADRRYRHLTIAKETVAAINERLDAVTEPPLIDQPVPVAKPKNIINTLDLSQKLSRKDYDQKLSQLQGRLGQLARAMKQAQRSAVLVFEGSDAAGKGGCIRRIIHALDARFYRVIPIASPTDEERARPYLWRFWRTLPRRGEMRIYDRSWYGRVLVERIENFCQPEAWQRAYAEINDFEDQLADSHTTVVKFWLSIDSDEQLARFQEREKTGYKRYKLTEEDWRNRDKWSAYEAAACEMIEHTSTLFAPWNLIEANDKLFARIKVLTILCDRIEKELDTANGKKKRKEKKD